MVSPKRTISAVLILVTLSKVKCQVLEDSPNIMASLPGERLLRGSNEEKRPIELIPPLDQTQERPSMFFNAEEAKSVRMKDQDLIIDPVTGQTMIKHINEKNEEADYLIRPTDVAIKNLQGFYVGGDVTESDETSETFDPATEESTTTTVSLPADLVIDDQQKLAKSTTPLTFTTEEDSAASLVTDYQTDASTPSETPAAFTDTQTDKDDVYKAKTTPNAEAEIKNNMEVRANSLDIDSTNARDSTEAASPAEAEAKGISGRLGLPQGLVGPVVDTVGRSLNDNKVSVVPLSAMVKSAEDQRPKVKLSKRDTLRSWLQDPWLRSPIGILVPLQSRSLSRALSVWQEVTSPEGLNLTLALLIGYHDSGIGWMSKHNIQNPDGIKSVANAIQKLLFKYQSSPPNDKGAAALHACVWASRHVPYDSALFVVTDTAPSDAHRLPAALRSVIDKRLKLYTIWTDPLYPSEASEQAVTELKKASKNTEGEFLDYHPAVKASNMAAISADTTWGRSAFGSIKGDQRTRTGRVDSNTRDKHETLLVRRINGGGPAALGVPVETGVESLRVRIDGRIDRATLYPPTGSQIDLLNATAVSNFAPGSRIESEAPLEAVLVFPLHQDTDSYATVPAEGGAATSQKKSTVGLWRLSVRCSGCEYRVLVTAQAPVGLDSTMITDDMLRLRARGPIASVRETTLIDEYGTELAKLPFSHQPATTEEGLEENLADMNMPSLVADVPLPPVKRTSKVYAKVVGRDVYGEPFTRVAGPIFRQETRTSRSASVSFPDERSEGLQSTFVFPDEGRQERARLLGYNETTGVLTASTATAQITGQAGTLLTAVQIGLSTRLYGAPGDSLQLHFEVTNYRERSVYFRFGATGNLRFLRGIRPTAQWINAGQTANVIVDVGITASAQVGARDLITFNATAGTEPVSISAYVYVLSPELQIVDTWAPTVRHTFHGDCITKLGDDCARHTWAATVYARDNDGGLLRLSSSPVGLRYEYAFTAGTREEVVATYRATCCAPRVLVTAVDAYGNANTYTVDITYYIPDAAIAAIVLGVLLFIALIALIIFLVVLCIRRRKESRQLPSYATSRRETS